MKTYKRLPDGAKAVVLTGLGQTQMVMQADPDLRRCWHCKLWTDQRPDPVQEDRTIAGIQCSGKAYYCGNCNKFVGWIPDPIATREELREKIAALRKAQDLLCLL